MWVLGLVVWIVSAAPIAVTVLPVFPSAKGWVRIWDYPRLQVAVALGVMAVVQLLTLPTRASSAGLLGATLGCIAWQVFRIYPYTRLKRPQVASADDAGGGDTISILVANVLQDNRDSATFLRRVAESDPDIVFAVETDAWWDAQLGGLESGYPYVVRHPLENTYGIHLFSRRALRGVRLQDRVEPDVPSVTAEVRLDSGTWVHLHCVHPKPPQIGQDVEERDAELLLVAREVARDARPAIVCGDLNDVAWSHSTRLFQRISGLLDPRIGRGFFATFHAKYWFARWPLDHVFHHASFRLARLEVLGFFGSDHFPVFVRLVHEPDAARAHAIPEADEDDRREAAEKIDEGAPGATG